MIGAIANVAATTAMGGGGTGLFSGLMSGAGALSSLFGGKKSDKSAKAMSALMTKYITAGLEFEQSKQKFWETYERPYYQSVYESATRLQPQRERNEGQALDLDYRHSQLSEPLMGELMATAGDRGTFAEDEFLANYDASESRAMEGLKRDFASYGLDVSGGDFAASMSDMARKGAAGRAAGLNKVRAEERDRGRAEMTSAITMNPALPGSGLTRPGTTSQSPNYGQYFGAGQQQQNFHAGQAKDSAASFGSSMETFGPFVDGLMKSKGFSFRKGGLVKDPGDGTPDSVPATVTDSSGVSHEARLDTGEFVIPAEETAALADKFGGHGQKTAEQIERIVGDFIRQALGGGLQKARLV